MVLRWRGTQDHPSPRRPTRSGCDWPTRMRLCTRISIAFVNVSNTRITLTLRVVLSVRNVSELPWCRWRGFRGLSSEGRASKDHAIDGRTLTCLVEYHRCVRKMSYSTYYFGRCAVPHADLRTPSKTVPKWRGIIIHTLLWCFAIFVIEISMGIFQVAGLGGGYVTRNGMAFSVGVRTAVLWPRRDETNPVRPDGVYFFLGPNRPSKIGQFP